MSLNQEFHWNTLFNKYDKIEKDLLKIMESAQKSNEYTVRKLNNLVKENRTFECELINMNREMTKIVEKLEEECLSTDDVQKKLQTGIKRLKIYVTKGMKIQTSISSSEGNINVKIPTIKTKQKKRKKLKADHETNLSYSQKSINIKNSDSDVCIKNITDKKDDVSKEIEEKEEQIYNTINWAYEKMKLFENNIKTQNSRVGKQEVDTKDETNTEIKNVMKKEQNLPNRKGIILDQLKFMHQNLKDELVELQKSNFFLNNTNTAVAVNWTNNVDYKGVEDVVGTQINAFSEFMTEILSQLTFFYHKITTENENFDHQNSIQTKSKKELLYILRDTCDVMKTIFLTITEKFIDNNVEAAFKRGIEESKIKETNESIQCILNQLISTFKKKKQEGEAAVNETNEEVVEGNSITNIKLSKHEVLEQFKITYENMKKAYNSTIQELRDNKIEVEEIDVKDKSARVKPSKIPKYKYKQSNLPKISNKNSKATLQLDNKIEEVNDKDLEGSYSAFTEESKVYLLKQLNSTYEIMTSEYELIKQKLKEDNLTGKEVNQLDRENGIQKSKIAVQDILKQLKNTYETMKNEYNAVVQNLNDRSLENKITEEELLLLKLEKVKQNKQEILHRLKSVSVLGGTKKRKMKKVYKINTKPEKRKDLRSEKDVDRFKCIKKPKRSKRFSAKLKCYNMKDDNTQFTKNICGHFVIKHIGNEKSNQKRRNRHEMTKSINKDNKECKNLVLKVNKNLNNEENSSKMIKNKLGQPMSRYEKVKEEYMQLTTNTENLLKKINQIQENINLLETKIENKTKSDKLLLIKKVFEEFKFIYTDLKEKYKYYATENDILNMEIIALERDKTNIEKDMSSLENKIKNFKTNKSKFASKMLLSELESAYEGLKEDFNQRITNKQTKLGKKISKFINDRRNLEEIMMLLETRVEQYGNGNFKETMNDVIKELELNYDILKKQYKQIISEKKTNIKEEITSIKNVKRKIEKEMNNIELKLKIFKIGYGKSHVLKQLKDVYVERKKEKTMESQTVKENSKILKMNTEKDIIITRSNNVLSDYELIYIKEEQVQTTDDKENQTHINDSIKNPTILLEDVTTSTASIRDEDISTKISDSKEISEIHVSGKKDDEIIVKKVSTINLQTEELSSRSAKNKYMFTETDKVAENISTTLTKHNLKKEELVEDAILKIKAEEQLKRMDDCNMVRIEKDQLNLIIDKIELCDSKTVEGIMDEWNLNYSGKCMKGDEIIRKAEEQLRRLDKELNKDMAGKGGDIVKIAEEQLDRIKRYLRTYNESTMRKVDECMGIKFKGIESNNIRNKSKNTLEHMKNIDLKELILLHENMVKCEGKEFEEKFKKIRQLKSVLKMQFNGRKGEKKGKGQESGDKPKLKVMKLPNQSLCGYQSVDLEDEINKNVVKQKVPQKVESVFEIAYVNCQNEDNVQTNKLKMILKAEKEIFKELKQVLMEKSDRLENINDILKRMLENTTDSNIKNQYNNEGNETEQNRGDTTVHSKMWNLKRVNLPSQNLKPKTSNEDSIREKSQETGRVSFLNFKKHENDVESETEVAKNSKENTNEEFQTLESNLELEEQRMLDYNIRRLETERETKKFGRYKNLANLEMSEKRLKGILDSMTPEDIYNMHAYLKKILRKKSSFPENEISSSNNGYSSNNDIKNVFQENKKANHFDIIEKKSDEIFKLKKEIAELKLEGRQREEQFTIQQQFEDLGNTNKNKQKNYRGLLNDLTIFEDDIEMKNNNKATIDEIRDEKGWFEMSVGKNKIMEENQIKSRTIQYAELFDSNDESKNMNSLTILCKSRFDSSEHSLEDNDYLEKLLDKYENLKDILEDKFNTDNELIKMRIEDFFKKDEKPESSIILEEPIFIENQIKENNTPDLLKNFDSKRFQLKGNIILKDEVASMIWETVIGRDYDMSIFNHDMLSSRPKEITINDLFLDQKTSFDTDLFYPKSKENEEEIRVGDVVKSAVLNEEKEADLIDTSEIMEVTYSREIISLDVISEEMFIDSHTFE